MSDYPPPTEELPIFDSTVFLSGDQSITQNQADKRYLRYPNAQGTENLQAINVNGAADFNSTVNIDGITTTTNKINMNGTSTATNNIATRQLLLKDATTGISNGTTIYTNGNILIIDSVPPVSNNSLITFSTRNILNAIITSLSLSSSSISSPLPLQLTGVLGSSYIQTRSYSFYDINTGVAANGTISYQATGMDINCLTSNSNLTITTQNGSNVNTNSLIINSTNLRTLTPTIPLTTDNSDKIPTTAWVQNVLSSFIPTIPTYVTRNASVSRNNITGNFILSTITISQIQWLQNQFLTLRIEYNMQWNKSVVILNNQANQTTSTFINIYPYRFTTAWLNDGGGQAGAPRGQISTNIIYGANTAFGVIDPLCPLGRQFWCNNWIYETTGTTGTATGVNSQLCICGHPTDINKFVIVVVNPNGYSVPTAAFDFNLSVEVVNYGRTPLPIISSSGFDYNFTLP